MVTVTGTRLTLIAHPGDTPVSREEFFRSPAVMMC